MDLLIGRPLSDEEVPSIVKRDHMVERERDGMLERQETRRGFEGTPHQHDMAKTRARRQRKVCQHCLPTVYVVVGFLSS